MKKTILFLCMFACIGMAFGQKNPIILGRLKRDSTIYIGTNQDTIPVIIAIIDTARSAIVEYRFDSAMVIHKDTVAWIRKEYRIQYVPGYAVSAYWTYQYLFADKSVVDRKQYFIWDVRNLK